jgi:NAD(P)H-hydrate epimerase
MKIFQCNKIKELDQYTIEHEPIRSIDLMERAATALFNAIVDRWSVETPFVIFAGQGNNGGDALAVARMLVENGYDVETFLFNTSNHLSEDCAQNRDRLMAIDGVKFTEVAKQFQIPQLTIDHVVVDGLFGTGLNKPLSGGYAGLVNFINSSDATVVAIDTPSGLNGDGIQFGVYPPVIIKADLTLTLQVPKMAFFFAECEEYVGTYEVLDIGLSEEGMDKLETPFSLVEEDDITDLFKPRSKFAHKGDFGHALLVAGSYGMAGAAIMAAKACLKSGVGLLTVHTPSLNLPMLQTVVPEAMVEPDMNEYSFSTPMDIQKYDAIAMGPGLGQRDETVEAFLLQLEETQSPIVLDADALNILAANKDYLKKLPPCSILTPHPKELERLVGACASSNERLQKAIELSAMTHSYVILKGAYSAVISPNGHCVLNTTGNAGMATGGSGDVLTGIILALLAQNYAPGDAAALATYIHGLAGDFAAERFGMTSMTAMDIVEALPDVWKQFEK